MEHHACVLSFLKMYQIVVVQNVPDYDEFEPLILLPKPLVTK
jgi:hypothetical protein